MTTTSTCLQCGAVLPGHAAAWLCPKCLLRQAVTPPDLSDPEGLDMTAPPAIHYFGDYELLHEIARGGMGVVYKARQVSLNRTVAVKLLLFGKLAGGEFVKRFRAEAEAAASLQHPNIVAIHEVGEHEGQQYFSMDYVAGTDLAKLVREKPLPPDRAAAYLKTIAEAIDYAHQRGVLHRDLKPSNILITTDDQPRITDFGLAKRLESTADLTVTGQVLGTPHYMPPEQAGGKPARMSAASDVYSLGAILYHALTGRPPFLADTVEAVLAQLLQNDPVPPRLLNARIPRDLETICLKCLNKEPSRRYDSALGLAQDLGHWLNDEPILARPVSRSEKLWRWCRRKPALATLILALNLVGLAGLAGILWQWRRAETNADNAVAKLREAYLAQARANRLSGRPGQRFDTLAAISNAVALHPPPVQRDELRNQAIAAMSLPDFVPVWTLENREPHWNGGSIDLTRFRYALVTAAGHVELRQVSNNELLFELPARDAPAHLPLEFSPDGRFLGVCYTNARVAVWDLEQRRVVVEGPGVKFRVENVAFSADSGRVAIAGASGTLVVYDLAARRSLCTITNQTPLEHVIFDPTGRRLAIGSPKFGRTCIVDVESGRILHELNHDSSPRTPGWHPFRPLLAVGSGDGFVRFWNPDTGEHTAIGVADNGECGGTAFNHGGDFLLCAGWTRIAMFRPTVPPSLGAANSNAATFPAVFKGMGNGSLLRFAANDRYLSRSGWGFPQPKLEIAAVSGAPEVRVFPSPRPESEFLRFALNPDGTLAALGLTNAIQILEVETGIELARLPLPGAQEPLFLPDGAGLVATSDDGLFTWAFKHGTAADEIRVEPPRMVKAGTDFSRLAVSRRGRSLAAWHDDHAHVYSLPDMRSISRVGNHLGGACLGPSFSADETLLASTRWNSANIAIWKLAGSNLHHTIKVTSSFGPRHGRAAFTPDGQWLFVRTGKDLRLYEPESWTLRASIPWNGGAHPQAFLAEGKVVAVSSQTGGEAVHLLTLPDFKELAVLEAASNMAIAHLGASGNGLKLFAVREDGEVNVWHLPLIAAGLAELGLAWDARLPVPGSRKAAAPPRFRVETAAAK